MKKSILTLLVILVSLTLGANSIQKTNSKGARTIYYVVVGSFSDYNKALYFNENGPYDTTWGNVFKTTANGKIIYRVCESCYYSKAKAEKRAKEIKSNDSSINAWVWANQGLAKCTGPTLGGDGNYYTIKPK